jgi:NAD(P)-dependent dehydrogenase (short-subunit alcohol dehydrogenase family)
VDDQLGGKVVLVTGAGSGMGEAGAEIAGGQGASHVYLVDTNVEGGEAAAERVRSAGGQATFVAQDVTDEVGVGEVVARIVSEQGRLDCAWNNAGINDTSKPFFEFSMPEWDRMIAVNLTSVFICMKHELAQMVDQGAGAIVNTSSGAGLAAAPGLPHYTAAKHGVLGLTKVGATEFASRGIRVNAVCPGIIDTPMLRSWNQFDHIAEMMPGLKLGKASQVAEAAVWLLSDAADWVSGVSMVVDGGSTSH